MVAQATTWEAGAGVSEVQSHYGYVREFEVQLSYLRPCL